MSRLPLRPSLVAVLQALTAGARHGFDVINATGLPSGTVYPALARLEHEGLVESRWEDQKVAQKEQRPPRRYYEVTTAGDKMLAAAVPDGVGVRQQHGSVDMVVQDIGYGSRMVRRNPSFAVVASLTLALGIG